jgi:putative ABC transport system permease protein
LVADSYASQKGLKLGSTLDLNGTKFKVVGVVKPRCLRPLAQLQKLASQTSLANVVLVRADSGTSVAAVQKEIEQRFPHAQVATRRPESTSSTCSRASPRNAAPP